VEPVTLVVTALVAGATAGVSGAAATAVAEAYEALKKLVISCFRRGGIPEESGQELIDAAAHGTSPRAALEQQLAVVTGGRFDGAGRAESAGSS